MELLLLIFVFIFGVVVGYVRASKKMLDKLLSDPDSMISLLKKYKEAKDDFEAEEKGTNAKVGRELEVHKEHESFYLFAKDNGQFLGQGKTIEEALDAVRKRFPKQDFHGHIPADEAKQMGLSKQN